MISPYALAGFAVYLLGSYLLGEFFPFSRFNMYAVKRDEGAVPVFLAEGRPAEVERYERFTGIEPEDMCPEGFKCSLMWEIHEARRWIQEHRSDEPAPGGVPVQWGFRLMKVDESGRLSQTIRIVSQGTALPIC